MCIVFVAVAPVCFVRIRAGGIRQRPRHKYARTAADHAYDGFAREFFQAEGNAHAVDGGSDVRGGVDQRAVHVERDDCVHGCTLSNQIGMVWLSGRRACASSPGSAVTPRFQ